MSTVQRQHFSYLIAQCWSATGELSDAVAYLDDALTLSVQLDDTSGIAECAYLRGSTNAMRTAYADASLDFLLCLQTLRERPGPSATRTPAGADDPSLELYALLGRATAEFMLGHNNLASDLLDEADPFIRLAPDSQRERAIHNWLRSNVLRWTGAPGLALPLAIEAADLLALHGGSEAQGRINGIVAETALDLAELFADAQPHHPARDINLHLAATSIDRSLALARASDDPIGEGLALLALARLRRITGRHLARRSLIQDAAQIARQRRDHMLLGQAHIAMGHELASGGHPDQARNRYVAAREVLERTDGRAIALLAERALLNLSYVSR